MSEKCCSIHINNNSDKPLTSRRTEVKARITPLMSLKSLVVPTEGVKTYMQVHSGDDHHGDGRKHNRQGDFYGPSNSCSNESPDGNWKTHSLQQQ